MATLRPDDMRKDGMETQRFLMLDFIISCTLVWGPGCSPFTQQETKVQGAATSGYFCYCRKKKQVDSYDTASSQTRRPKKKKKEEKKRLEPDDSSLPLPGIRQAYRVAHDEASTMVGFNDGHGSKWCHESAVDTSAFIVKVGSFFYF